ncbi:D-arabinono-1,4-lactone oxidase [uncultured Ilumatobacter sp.]|uniref:D-arabinono-1,4-lactone oxidase n=1 Tax=uncultured Ilumatobacter sp. TaxID=879968 RepID=UPI00374E64DD
MRVPVRNWAGNQRCHPTGVHKPTSTADIVGIVTAAYAAGERVKVIASGHSFTDTAMTDGHLISLDAMKQVLSTDGNNVTVQAGIRIHALNNELATRGLALPNLGDIAYQSIAGATATATHGTGAGLGNISTCIVGLEMVTGDGTIIRADEQNDPELLRIARVSVGALGILTEVTLRCVPAFNLHAVETIEVLHDVVADFRTVMHSTDHVEFYMMPGARRCQVKRNTVTDALAAPQSKAAYIRDKWIGENLAFGTVCRVGRRFPKMAPKVAKLVMSAASERELIDRSDRIFASPRKVRFLEMEYGVPFDAVPEALSRIEALVKTLPVKPMFPIEVRCSAADDIPLSTGNDRASGWIAVHQYIGVPYEAYFQGVEQIMNDYTGRPHWGKLHYQTAATLAYRFPEWDAFQELRRKLDPTGTFRNAYTDRVLGPV